MILDEDFLNKVLKAQTTKAKFLTSLKLKYSHALEDIYKVKKNSQMM